MGSARFTVLTGHLSQYSLADLIGILRHQRKTGRLIIEYLGSPAILFFRDGNLVDAQYNTLVGVQAIFVAFVQPPAAFNFNPLIQPTRDSIDYEQQRVILELLGCWTEDPIVVKSVAPRDDLIAREIDRHELGHVESQLVLPPAPESSSTALPEAKPVLALSAGPTKWSHPFRGLRRSWVLAAATFCLLLVFGVPTLIAINNKARKTSTPTASLLNEANTESTSPAVKVSDTVSAPAETEMVNKNGAPEVRKEHAQVDQQSTEREQVSNKPRSEEALDNTSSIPAQPKDSAKSTTNSTESTQAAKPKQPSTNGQTVRVVMRIENGRVVQATVGDRRPGSEAYEAMALRIARQRRYPAGVSKQETLLMKVDGPK